MDLVNEWAAVDGYFSKSRKHREFKYDVNDSKWTNITPLLIH
jgi:hypothetical protein